MQHRIQRARASYFEDGASCDFSFLVQGAYEPEFGKPVQAWAIRAVSPYRKDYGFDADALKGHLSSPDSALFTAAADAGVGHIAVSKNWNCFGLVDDIAIDSAHRGLGLAERLMDAAADWARSAGLSGLMLETQNNNMAACRFYQRYGFELGGIDRLLYRGLDSGTEEVALFWYLSFASAKA